MAHYVNIDAPNAIWFGTFYRYKWVYLFSQVANFHAFGCARFLYLPPVHKHFHCMLIKFTHKAPHTIYLYVCFRTIPGSTMLDTKMLLRLYLSRSLSVSLYLSIANDDLRICENHKYWICVRVARRFSLSRTAWILNFIFTYAQHFAYLFFFLWIRVRIKITFLFFRKMISRFHFISVKYHM